MKLLGLLVLIPIFLLPVHADEGDIRVSLVGKSGNSADSQDFSMSGKYDLYYMNDKIKFRGNYEKDVVSGETITDKWDAHTSYNKYLTESLFGSLGFDVSSDELADLNKRYEYNISIGNDFFKTAEVTLSGKTGFSYVSDDNIIENDSDYMAFTWGLDYSQNITEKTQVYHNNTGLVSLKESDYTIKSKTGIKTDLIHNLFLGLELQADYRNVQDEIDYIYRFNIGYNF